MNNGIITVLIVAHNELEYLKVCLQSLNLYKGECRIRLIVVDHVSTDQTKEWLAEENGKSELVVNMEIIEGNVIGYAAIVNAMIQKYAIKDDLLLLCPQYVFTQGCMEQLQYALHRGEIGAVAPLSNGYGEFAFRVQCAGADYQHVVQLFDDNRFADKECIGLFPGCLLFRTEIMEQIGIFDEQFVAKQTVLNDFFRRMLIHDSKLLTVGGAFSFCINKNFQSDIIYFSLSGPNEQGARLKEKWGIQYFNNMYNPFLLDQIKMDKNAEDEFRVLEVGCDCGANLLEIHNLYPHAEVYGYELNPRSAAIAAHVADVREGNIEDENLLYEKGLFDYIIFGDVLEHLRNPQRTVEYCRQFLKTGGYIIASIPNIMHVSVLRDLLKGNFTYAEMGLLDRTHIHFFTYNEIVKMFDDAAYEILYVGKTVTPIQPEEEKLIDALMQLSDEAQRFMFETFQYSIRAKKKERTNKQSVFILKGNQSVEEDIGYYLGRAYKRDGYPTHAWKMSSLQSKINQLLNMLQNGMEFALLLNGQATELNIAGENIWSKYQVPCMNYLTDPWFLFPSVVLKKLSDMELIACTNRRDTRYIQRLRAEENAIVFLPISGSKVLGGSNSIWHRRSIPVLYIGDYIDADIQLDDFEYEVMLAQMEDPERIIEEIIEEKVRDYDPEAGESEIVDSIINHAPAVYWSMQRAIIKALTSLAESGISLYICGKGWETAKLNNYPQVTISPYLSTEEKMQYMSESKVVLHVDPWNMEGFSNNLINGMLAGAICVTNDNLYLQEQFEAGTDYVPFSLRHLEELPKLVTEILSDEEKANHMLKSAATKAQFHTWENQAEQMKSIKSGLL